MPCSVLGSIINPGPFVSGLASDTDLGIGHTCTDYGTGIVNSLDSCSYFCAHFATCRDLGLITSFALASLELLADLMRYLRITGKPVFRP